MAFMLPQVLWFLMVSILVFIASHAIGQGAIVGFYIEIFFKTVFVQQVGHLVQEFIDFLPQ
jgi:hypothetical protein